MAAVLTVTATMLLAAGAGAASAATEFGDTCSGDDTAPGTYSLVTLSTPGSGLPLTAPTSGVITKVKVQNQIPFPFAVPTDVKVLRSAGGNSFTAISQVAVQVGNGQTTVDSRMPVQAGDRLGLHGTPFSYEGTPIEGISIYCDEVEGVLGATLGDVGVGSTANFEAVTAGRVPLAAVIEPDADNDGFGDETQDACPQSPVVQVACPPVTLSTSTQVKKGSVTVIVTSSTAAPVTVKGVAKLGKGRKAKLNGGTQNLVPGTLSKFRLFFTKALKNKLKELSPDKKLTLKVTVSGTSVAGALTTKTLKLKLKGQG
ncbi:MAG TPA: hypothetical protein VFN92_04170 [Solirubrobacterales bacterium]|nr:hypothetical protein [Solirubrobacterales bacterium]